VSAFTEARRSAPAVIYMPQVRGVLRGGEGVWHGECFHSRGPQGASGPGNYCLCGLFLACTLAAI
jgi:hypothetical protein